MIEIITMAAFVFLCVLFGVWLIGMGLMFYSDFMVNRED